MKYLLLLIFSLFSIMFIQEGFSQEESLTQGSYMHFPIGEKFFEYNTQPRLTLAEELQNRCWFSSTFVNQNEAGNVFYKFPQDMIWPGAEDRSTFFLITTNTTSFLDEKNFQKITPTFTEEYLILDFEIPKGVSQLLINSTQYLDSDGTTLKNCFPLFDKPPKSHDYYDKIFPLKVQISYAEAFGFSQDYLLCKEGQELVQKYNVKFACVSPETKNELILRGWTNITQGSI